MLLVATLALIFGGYCESALYSRNAVTNPARLWPNGKIPYTFHGQIDAYRKVHMLAAMKQVMLSTFSNETPCISFVPRTSEADYIEIQFAGLGGSGSNVGRTGGKQTLSVSSSPTHDELVRGLMFIIGVHPEVARPDRDNILEIVTSNIDSAFLGSFRIEQDTDTFRQPFDYDTVVMYGPYSFAIDPSTPSIKTKYDGFTIGQSISMSSGDVTLVQHVYKCSLDSSHRVDVLGPLQFECHFHFDLCQFKQDTQDDFDWVLREGPTATTGTGPNADHSSGSGSYGLAIASGHHNQVARLTTPNLPAGTYCFVLWLHAYGNDVGQLRVLQRTVDGEKTLMGVSKTPVNQWYHGSATVTSPHSQVSVILEAHIGNGDMGDIAVDDIYIYNGKCIDWY